jgi:DNA-binding HxlR family transcriptional regulator
VPPRASLTARLRALEEAGLVERRRYSEHPPRDEYLLTQAGRDLGPAESIDRAPVFSFSG